MGKSKHKHEYGFVEIYEREWFTHEKRCKICGHINNRFRVENDSGKDEKQMKKDEQKNEELH